MKSRCDKIARKKGSAFYGGYETECSFNWQLRNPAGSNQLCTLTFPLPAADAMYDGLVATLDGKDVLPQMEIKDSSLVLKRDVQPDEVMNFHIAFKSRGLSYWYFQVREAREIRDFTLGLEPARFAEIKTELSRRLHDADGDGADQRPSGHDFDVPARPRAQ